MSQRFCCGAEIAALKQKLGAAYVSIEDFAESLNATIQEAEWFLWGTQRKHNLTLVWLGQEEVGPEPIFISRPLGDGFDVALYSRLPQEQWRRP